MRLAPVELALKRVRDRVRQGGQKVPAVEVARRFRRGCKNFKTTYRALADAWAVYDNSGEQLQQIEVSP